MKKCKNKILMLLATSMVISISSSTVYASEFLFRNDGNISKAIAYDQGKCLITAYDSNNMEKLYFNDNGAFNLVDNYENYSLNTLTKYSQKYAQLNKNNSNYLVNLSDGKIDDSISIEKKAENAKKTAFSNIGKEIQIGFGSYCEDNPKAFEKIGTGQFDNTLYLYGMRPEEERNVVISFKLSDCQFESHYNSSYSRYTGQYSYYYTYTFMGSSCSAPKDDSEETRINELNSKLDTLGFSNVIKSTDEYGNIILIAHSKSPQSYYKMINDLYSKSYQNVTYTAYPILHYATVICAGQDCVYYGPDFVGFTDEYGNYTNTYYISSTTIDPMEDRRLYYSTVISEDCDNLYSMKSNYIHKVSKNRSKTNYFSMTSSYMYEPSSIESYKINDENIISLINDSEYTSLSECPCRVIDGKLYFTSVSKDGTKVRVSIVNLIETADNEYYAILESSSEHDIDDFNFNDSANTTRFKAYENSSVSIDNNGYTWLLDNGTIYKFDGRTFIEQFECDSELNRLDVFDDNDLIVYSSDGKGYASLQDGKQIVDNDDNKQDKDNEDDNKENGQPSESENTGDSEIKQEQPFTKDTPYTVNGIQYTLNHDNYVLVSKAAGEEITIPDKVVIDGKEYIVTSIGDRAFEDNEALKKVTINSENMYYIGCRAFYNCKNLESITIPKSVTAIGYDAFYNCDMEKLNFIIEDESSKDVLTEAKIVTDNITIVK